MDKKWNSQKGIFCETRFVQHWSSDKLSNLWLQLDSFEIVISKQMKDVRLIPIENGSRRQK